MGKLRTPYSNNKPKHKPSSRPMNNGGGKPYIKRSNNTSENEELDVVTGGKLYQKAVHSRDRYKEMAREAMVSGDRVLAENYHQHADHYCRIINAAHEADQEKMKLRHRHHAESNHDNAPQEIDGNAVVGSDYNTIQPTAIIDIPAGDQPPIPEIS